MMAMGAFKRGSFAFRAGASHTPPAGTKFKCVKRAVMRADFEMDSEAEGHFEVGEVFEALECRLNEKGQLRLRFDGGWTSVAAGSGTLLFAAVTAAVVPKSTRTGAVLKPMKKMMVLPMVVEGGHEGTGDTHLVAPSHSDSR